MSFKFNFNATSETVEENDAAEPIVTSDNAKAIVLHVENRHLQNVKDTEVCEMKIGEKVLKHLSSRAVEKQLEQTSSEVSQAVRDLSDLIPKVYEGGLKIWECSVDLTNYMNDGAIPLDSLNVLELGCGAGLPSLFAYASGATCCFQDFNEDVLHLLTIPNVILNTQTSTDNDNYCRASFIAGDWSVVPQILETYPRFDVILTSETIYNKSSQKSLLSVMKMALHKNGSIYLAAKTCYFGVGGSLRQFEELLAADGTFSFRTVWKTEEGVQREILHLTFK